MSYTHGLSGYTNYGCRCFTCSGANREYMAKFRADHRGELEPDDTRHGTTNGYTNYGCRCDRCTAAHAAARAKQRAGIRERKARAAKAS